MMMAILDGAGLAMFLPLLKIASGEKLESGDEMEDLDAVLDVITGLGLPLTVLSVLILMLFFFLLKGVAKYGTGFYKVILNKRFANNIRLQNMRLLANYDYEKFSKADSGRIQNTFSGEVNQLNSAYRNYFTMLQASIMTTVYVSLACVSNFRFAIIVAVGGVLSNLVFNKIYGITKRASRRVTKEMHGFQGFLIESVSSFKFLKATNLISQYKEKVDHSIQSIEKETLVVGKMNALTAAIREPLMVLVVVIAIYIQLEVFEESMGAIVLSLLFFYRGLTSLLQVQAYYNSFLSASGSMENMTRFVNELTEDQESTGTIVFEHLQDEIAIQNLTFAYEDNTVLNNINLTIPKNKTIGLAGESGTGKTTLVNLICGLLKPAPGMIRVDGTDLLDLDIKTYRDRIGYVTQEPQMFSDTVFHNVTFWDERTPETERRFWRALELANADGFIRELPLQGETVIGINGINLSGGQRQRISIARELYRDIDILVLDEATSALDSQSEKLIQENIESLSGSYTILVIAHRFSTIQKADKIIYLKRDGVYDVGTFEQLQAESSSFKTLVDLQSVGTIV
jgi:subfamily B ATP-binding cassette protein MsbA